MGASFSGNGYFFLKDILEDNPDYFLLELIRIKSVEYKNEGYSETKHNFKLCKSRKEILRRLKSEPGLPLTIMNDEICDINETKIHQEIYVGETRVVNYAGTYLRSFANELLPGKVYTIDVNTNKNYREKRFIYPLRVHDHFIYRGPCDIEAVFFASNIYLVTKMTPIVQGG